MTNSAPISSTVLRWLHRWAIAVLALLFVLLILGAVVTSFRVGMADPVWPTRPWHLLLISWAEPQPGFIIEHTHRLVGFMLGGAVAILALALWLTEPWSGLRWAGFATMVALLVSFGQLHGTLIHHQKVFQQSGELAFPHWTTALAPTLIALAFVVTFAFAPILLGSRGGGLRLIGVALLVSVMVQGILGGLRVYLNALVGPELAVIHGVFSQIVLALAVAVVVNTHPTLDAPANDRWHTEAVLIRWGIVSAGIVFGQIVAGAILRHTASPLGPRLHLLGAFLIVFATASIARRMRCDTPRNIRFLAMLAAALAVVQILLGIEAWMIRFQAGFLASPFQPITEWDAIVRSAHVVVGYALFGTAVALALGLLRTRTSLPSHTADRRLIAELESVA